MLKVFLLICTVSVVLGIENAEPNKVYSTHTRYTPGTLDLSTSELKVFSGHAMNIIRSKCPNVDAQKIFQVQKYMGKLLAKKDPTPGKSKEFKTLLEAMTTCAKEGRVPQPEFNPFHGMGRVFMVKDDSAVTSGIDSTVVKDDAQPKAEVAKAEEVKPVPRVISTTVFVRPKDTPIRSSKGFFNWIHGMFSKVTSFFGNIFSFGHRRKRDVSGLEMPPTDSDATPSGADEPLQALSPYQVFSPVKDEPRGKQAFGTLIDEWCRIYCDTCSGRKETRNFKMAAKQLLEDLFEEDSGIEAAAQQYLDEEFLESIKECE